MSNETKLRAGLVFSILTSLWLTLMWNNSIITVKEQQNKIDSLTKVSDNLHDELFNTSIEVGRYELTFDHLNEKYPKIATEMENWKNHETE